MKALRILLALTLLSSVPRSLHAACDRTTGAAAYTGRFHYSDGSSLMVYTRDGSLALRPLFWTSEQILKREHEDSFVVDDRPQRTAVFRRDAKGCVDAVSIKGIEKDELLARATGLSVADLLFEHRPLEAAAAVKKNDGASIDVAIGFGERLLQRFPTRAADALAFVRALAARAPARTVVHRVLGDAYVATGDAVAAEASYQRALALDPSDSLALRGLRMLGDPDLRTEGWKLPFTLRELFAAPSKEELDEVLADWAGRDLRPRDVRVVETRPIRLPSGEGELRVVAHRVSGSLHYGVVIVPRDVKPGSCPVVLDAKGVSWNYFPRSFDPLPDSVRLAQADAGKLVFFIPGFRGETMIVGDKTYLSEGDRTDVWDGATDDTLAFLHAALRVTPEADGSRVGIFGRSRGGTVALLAAVRDPAIDCVVAWSAPTDHFVLMGQEGWRLVSMVAEGLRERSAADGIGGQFIETFLHRAIAGEMDLAETRRMLIESSPLYFADRLPPTQLHSGEDDPIVPSRNSRELLLRAPTMIDAHFYPGFGHDTDKTAADVLSRTFLREHLLSSER